MKTKTEKIFERLRFTPDDMQRVGDHYWAKDYAPDYGELCELARVINTFLKKKIDETTTL